MKTAPVSGDMLLQLALLAAGVGLVWYLYRQTAGKLSSAADAVSETVGDLVDAAGEVADAVIVGVNPSDPGNWVNQGVGAVGSALVSDTGPGRNADGSWTVGGWLYDLANPGWSDNLSGPVSAVPTPVMGGGAAFGFFPQLGRGNQSAVNIIAERGRVVGGL